MAAWWLAGNVRVSVGIVAQRILLVRLLRAQYGLVGSGAQARPRRYLSVNAGRLGCRIPLRRFVIQGRSDVRGITLWNKAWALVS